MYEGIIYSLKTAVFALKGKKRECLKLYFRWSLNYPKYRSLKPLTIIVKRSVRNDSCLSQSVLCLLTKGINVSQF